MNENGLTDLMSLIKRQKWERLFKRRELMHVAACKKFYKNLTVSISKRKEVARSSVRGVRIELDGMILAGILGIPGNNGICEYIKEVWEPSKYYKPLEMTKKFANNDLIIVARRVKSTEMKPFQRFLHFIFMKNVVPRFGKRDNTSFMDLTYMDHMLTRRLVNLPRNEEVADEGQNNQEDFDWEAVIDEVEIQREEMEKEVEIQGESGSAEMFYDVEVEVEGSVEAPVEDNSPTPAPSSVQQKEQTVVGVDPSGPSSSIPDSDFQKLQVKLDRARTTRLQAELDQARAENARHLALLQLATPQLKP
ncbi:hypothetical protein Dimus_027027 [Dionaea muscipula]